MLTTTQRYELVVDGLMTVKEACDLLRIARSTLYQLISDGLLAVVKIGRSCRLSRRSVIEFAAARLSGGTDR
jgi:excisionase family DNA binding protein